MKALLGLRVLLIRLGAAGTGSVPIRAESTANSSHLRVLLIRHSWHGFPIPWDKTNLPAGANMFRNVLVRQFMHGRWWLNNPDCLLLAAPSSESSEGRAARPVAPRYALYLLYWYKSTSTDAEKARLETCAARALWPLGCSKRRKIA
jgi:hypothetical protein